MSGPTPEQPSDAPREPERKKGGQPKTAPPGTAVSGFPEPPGPGSTDPSESPHHGLNNPVGEPDPTEWPDPYEQREDPRADEHPPTGSGSTSEPRPSQDPEAEPWEGPK